MKPQFWLKLFLISPVLTAASISAYQEAGSSSVPSVLRHGALEVWVPKTFISGFMSDPSARIVNEYDWPLLVKEFQKDFPAFSLHLKVFEPDDFLKTLLASKENPPDVAFLDSRLQVEPLVKDDSVIQPMPLGSSRFSYNGRWTIFRKAKNPEAARAFALWLVQSPHWTPPKLRTGPMASVDVAAIQSVARDAVSRLLTGDVPALSLLMDPEAAHFDSPYTQVKTLTTVDPVMAFGNSRLAFVLVSAVGEGRAVFGMSHSALVLRKADDHWRVLLFQIGSLPQLENQLRLFDNMGLRDGEPNGPERVMLLSPADRAKMTRWPKGEIEWATTGPDVAGYVVESQFVEDNPLVWSPSWIRTFSPQQGQSSMRIRTPFGVGAQPHRWRVWAISTTGVISTSEWRTIDFTN